VDEQNLVGPEKRIRQNWAAWADSGATGISVATRQIEAIHLMADIAGTKETAAAE
jgi:hypothetical protein